MPDTCTETPDFPSWDIRRLDDVIELVVKGRDDTISRVSFSITDAQDVGQALVYFAAFK